jgi:excisionase family DNA binding protein
MSAAPAYLSARDAAARCGVSERTVRRWIVKGRLPADRDGREFRIACEALAPFLGHAADNGQGAAAESDMSAASPQQGAALSADVAAGLLHLVDRLQRENLELAGRLGFLQAELQQRDETIRALQAPREEPENAVSVTVVSADQVDAPPPRLPSWWRRVLLGE